ncbi:MarR family winged helix-turn-helix transcriptional regulator [Phaeacidiphilus oryzae]|uniref:MarR family winged helix-turn-helix transcriptional regulator n=1 Tax=Phaeacidiphilus oryzae TaxID=348818 RepID=UPI00055AC706|nr:MarR family winged helix-turn-helix transcriptional regulator [Phaeacidiphilus oryzae]
MADHAPADSPSTAAPRSRAPEVPAQLADAPGFLARRLYQAYLAVWVRHVDSALTGPQFAVLQLAEANPGSDQRSIAALAALDNSTMTDVARRLEGRGLLDRRSDPADGRRKIISPTERGLEVLRTANRHARELDELLLKPYPTDRRAELVRELQALADHWEGLT